MDTNEKWLSWAVELQALAQAGLHYGKDVYDLERYRRIREIAAEMVTSRTALPLETVKDLFCGERGYQTPKLDTRAAIFRGEKILMVRENNGTWSLPGGWVDVNLSVGESARKEIREEAGLDAEIERVIAVQDRERHNRPVYAWKVCKIFLLCTELGGAFRENPETVESRWFSLEELPNLAEEKNSREQIEMCFAAKNDPNWRTIIE